jgi:hypothetical protein
MISTLESFFHSTNNKKEIDILEKSLKFNINFFITSVKNISGEKLDLNELLLSYEKESLEFINEIVHNWNYLRHKISPFSFQKLVHYTPKFLKKEVKYNYSQLIINLKRLVFNYDSMLFANDVFVSKLFSHKQNKTNETKNVAVDQLGNGTFELSTNSINEMIENFNSESLIQSYKDSLMSNAHFLRKSIISTLFETILEYFQDSETLNILYSNDWFKVLYLLNNSISREKIVKFQNTKAWGNSNNVSWNGIFICHGQLSFSIKYNDKQIRELLQECVKYFDKNENILSLDKK